jgi:hypothetical protein
MRRNPMQSEREYYREHYQELYRENFEEPSFLDQVVEATEAPMINLDVLSEVEALRELAQTHKRRVNHRYQAPYCLLCGKEKARPCIASRGLETA